MSQRHGAERDHERARELAALTLDEPLAAAEAAWLEAHLAACSDCRSIAAEYVDGRNALRTLRGAAMEPPRDLWARTAARIETEAARRPNRNPAPRGAIGGRVPLGVFAPLAAMLVVAIAVGAGLLNGTSLAPVGTGAMPTPIAITAAADVQVLNRAEDGSVQILSRPVNAVCPAGSSECGIKRTFNVTNVGGVGVGSLNGVMSPHRDRLVVVASSNGTQGVYVMPVSFPTPVPSATGTPGASSGSTASVFPASPVVVVTGTPGSSATPSPATDPSASPASSPSIPVSPEPDGVLEIASNVVVVGPAAYSPDGTQVAFSARPADGSAGPDVYLWTSGESVARALTTDHAAQFASWTTQGILVSRVADGTPATTLLDPATGTETPVAIGAAWLPVVDPTGTVGAWWAGTVKRNEAGDWVPGVGSLVVGPWPSAAGAGSVPPAPAPTPAVSASAPASPSGTGSAPASPPMPAASGTAAASEAAASATASAAATATAAGSATPSADPSTGASPSATDAPANIQVLTHGGLAAWAVRWDETGTAMAVWTLGTDAADSADGATETPTPDASATESQDPSASPATSSSTAPDAPSRNIDTASTLPGAPTATALPAGSLPAETAAAGSPSPTPAGRLSLYRLSTLTLLADLEHPMLDAAPADGGFSLRTGRLAWTAHSTSGELVLQVLAWFGTTIGRLELPAATGAMIVP